MSQQTISQKSIQNLVQSKILEVIGEPAFNWQNGFKSFMADDQGLPVVRVAVANCAPDMDLWDGLRSPAQVGMYPLTLGDIWSHYAAMNVQGTRPDGSPNPLAMPETFQDALRRFRRVVIVSAMLAVNPQVYQRYAEKIERGDADPFDYYACATGEVSTIINKSLAKAALSLMSPERAVIPMTNNNAETIIQRTRSEYLNGRYHGPCNNHWPQNSIAVMTGLLRFGINRLPFRDEVALDGSRQRLFGRYTGVVIFDETNPVSDGTGGVTLLNAERIKWLKGVTNYTNTDPDIAGQRYCTYNLVRADGKTACGKCLEACPSNALPNSSPLPDGRFDEQVAVQQHRFWNGVLDFDFANCSRDRTSTMLNSGRIVIISLTLETTSS